ncbi:class I SAM-dependent methyltransferase [Nocardia callitridis]|uniref:Methyltransferase domain-containing protein n=1 Tax=Nocardia callitridis TaxID=648753 RepID=A0ABP9JZT2_9NOCA
MSANPLAVADVWDLVADGYAEFAAKLVRPFAAQALEFAALTPRSRVIDVACGPGTLSLLAAQRVARVHAVDFSEPMIAQLAYRARAEGVDNIDGQVADGQALPFEDGVFDAGFSMFGVMFFRERSTGLAELLRVLRPGATAVVSSWAPALESPLMRLISGAVHAADPYQREPKPDYLGMENPDIFHSEMRAAGFRAVSIQRHTNSLTFDGVDDLFDSMIRSSAGLMLLRRSIGEREWARREELIKRHLTERYHQNRPLPTVAYLGIGQKPLE